MVSNSVVISSPNEELFLSAIQSKTAELEAEATGEVEIHFSTAYDKKHQLMYSALLVLRTER